MFEKNLNISILLDFYGDILSERQREMLELYYNEDYSLSEIADKYEISRQGVRSVLKKGEKILFDMENKLQLAQRFTKMLEKSAQIANELEIINKSINNEDISLKIHDLITQIKELADY